MATAPTDIAHLLGVSKTVYALELPEAVAVRRAVFTDGLAEGLTDHAWTRKQDTMHAPLLNGWLSWIAPVCDFAGLEHAYPTNGSSEAIRDAICEIAARGDDTCIHVFAGEYEGYESLASAYGVRVERHDRHAPFARMDAIGGRDVFFLSQPSAIDGNLWAGYDAFMEGLAERRPDVEVMLDLCYVGCVARDYKVRASFPNVSKVFFSLSKSFGVYYYRIGGVFSRAPMPGLWGNMWFKNLASISYGIALLEAHPDPRELPARYRAVQERAAAAICERIGVELVPSDVFLLAHKPYAGGGLAVDGIGLLDDHLRRAESVRYCLTPEMDRIVGGKRETVS